MSILMPRRQTRILRFPITLADNCIGSIPSNVTKDLAWPLRLKCLHYSCCWCLASIRKRRRLWIRHGISAPRFCRASIPGVLLSLFSFSLTHGPDANHKPPLMSNSRNPRPYGISSYPVRVQDRTRTGFRYKRPTCLETLVLGDDHFTPCFRSRNRQRANASWYSPGKLCAKRRHLIYMATNKGTVVAGASRKPLNNARAPSLLPPADPRRLQIRGTHLLSQGLNARSSFPACSCGISDQPCVAHDLVSVPAESISHHSTPRVLLGELLIDLIILAPPPS